MASVSGTALVAAPVNVTGLLFNKTKVDTPLFNMIKSNRQDSRVFNTGAFYDLGYPRTAHQGITETASLTAPEPNYWERENAFNVTQIFQESVAVSYRKQSNAGDMTDYKNKTADVHTVLPGANNVPNELSFQIANTMDKIKLDLEYTLINGTYQDSKGAAGTADRTRGINEAIVTNVVDASDSELNFDLLYTVAETILKSGSPFNMESYLTVVDFVTFKQLQKIVANEGLKIDTVSAGVNVMSIITPFGTMRFLAHRFAPAQTALVICMPVLGNVFQDTPGKGNFFYEPLAKTGAADKGQIYGQWGLDHGPEFVHAKITGLNAACAPFTAPQRYIVNPAGAAAAAKAPAESKGK